MKMKNKTKLLFVIYSLGIGGAEKSLINLLDELDYEKFDVDLLVSDYYGKDTQKGLLNKVNENVNIILPDKNTILITNNTFKCLFKNFTIRKAYYFVLGKIIKIFEKNPFKRNQKRWKYVYSKLLKKMEKEYDSAISYMHLYPNYFVIDKVKAKKKILWVHTDYSLFNANMDFERKYFKQANEIITISEKCLLELKKIFPEIKDKFKCLYNYTPINKIKNQALEFYPKEFDKEGINIISIGRLCHVKGFDVAIRSAKLLKLAGLKFKWVIIGTGELKEELQNMISDDIKENVILAGVKLNPYPYFKNCDILIQTSRREGKSIVLDEAKIFARPIICTNYNTVNDQITNLVNGLIVPLEDSEAIKNAIITLINNEKLRNNIITNIQKENPFISIKEYENLFELE